jgi:diadenosine tetraphosphatase ApaH/serine/threonine PP2A family protein phosphatase
MWVARVFKRPPYCEVCGNSDATRLEWANISGRYLRIRYDWMNMCIGCHRKFDTKTHCIHGHEFTPENTYSYHGKRVCKTCALDRSREHKRKIARERRSAHVG